MSAGADTAAHGTPADLLRCEFAAVGYRETALYDLQEDTYLAVFEPFDPQAGPASPGAIRPCGVHHNSTAVARHYRARAEVPAEVSPELLQPRFRA